MCRLKAVTEAKESVKKKNVKNRKEKSLIGVLSGGRRPQKNNLTRREFNFWFLCNNKKL